MSVTPGTPGKQRDGARVIAVAALILFGVIAVLVREI